MLLLQFVAIFIHNTGCLFLTDIPHDKIYFPFFSAVKSTYLYCWNTLDEVLLKRGRTSPTQLQVHLSSCLSTPIRACEERCTQTWTRVYLSWSCTRCTLQTSSPEPSLRGGGEAVCAVHRVQFQPQCQRGGSQVPRCRACEARGTWLTSELTLGRVGWSSPPFLEYFIWVHRHYGHTRYG